MGEYLDPYRKAVAGFGASFEALLWNSREAQRARFAAIIDTVDPAGRIIADMGCGRADLLAMMAREAIPYAGYVGVEAIDELLEFSRQRAGQEHFEEAEFIAGDFASDPGLFDRLVAELSVDTLVFSGSLNTFGPELAEQTLTRAWQALAQTPGGVLAFNFLSDRHTVPAPTGPARRFDTLGMIRWAFERTPIVAVRHDYLASHDCLIVMRMG